MAEPRFNDFIPAEMQAFAQQSVQQAQKAFDDLMSVAQQAVSTFEGQATTAQESVREVQRKVIAFSERNVAASLEFAQRLLKAQDPEEVIRLHADYVRSQIAALGEQAKELGQDTARAAAKAAGPGGQQAA